MPIEVTAATVAALGLAALLIGLSKGGLGGGFGPLVTILVALATSPSQAIGVLLPILMAGDVVAVTAHRGRWDRGALRRLLPGAAVGVLLASIFLGGVDDRGIEVFLAVFSLLFVAYRLLEQRLVGGVREVGAGVAWVAGATSGITSTVAHAGGPPIAVYLLASGTRPEPFVATTAAFFLVVNWLKVPGYLAAGLLDASMLRLAPLALLLVPGVYLGRWLVRRVDAVLFERVILVLLTVGAVYLLAG